MNEYLKIESGIYLNLFLVDVPNKPIKVMVTERSQYQDLRSLRDELKKLNENVLVYSDGDKIYGYGNDTGILQTKGFIEVEISLHNAPRLTGRMILEGFLEAIKQDNYDVIERKGRCEVFNWNKFRSTRDGKIKVFHGFDLRSTFLLDHDNNMLVFGLVVDVKYAFKDQSNQPLNTPLIRQRFDSQTLSEVRQIQGDLIPTGINSEVARQRLLDHILPFIKRFSTFNLPCNLEVKLRPEPIRVILGGNSV